MLRGGGGGMADRGRRREGESEGVNVEVCNTQGSKCPLRWVSRLDLLLGEGVYQGFKYKDGIYECITSRYVYMGRCVYI